MSSHNIMTADKCKKRMDDFRDKFSMEVGKLLDMTRSELLNDYINVINSRLDGITGRLNKVSKLADENGVRLDELSDARHSSPWDIIDPRSKIEGIPPVSSRAVTLVKQYYHASKEEAFVGGGHPDDRDSIIQCRKDAEEKLYDYIRGLEYDRHKYMVALGKGYGAPDKLK